MLGPSFSNTDFLQKEPHYDLCPPCSLPSPPFSSLPQHKGLARFACQEALDQNTQCSAASPPPFPPAPSPPCKADCPHQVSPYLGEIFQSKSAKKRLQGPKVSTVPRFYIQLCLVVQVKFKILIISMKNLEGQTHFYSFTFELCGRNFGWLALSWISCSG
jgi:hypothetical protein